MFLANLLRTAVEANPDRLAVSGAEQSWTFQQLDAAAGRLARTWQADGLEAGDRVALLLPNRPEGVLTYLACFKGGLIVVPLDYHYRPPQLNYALRHCGARVLVAHAERLDELAECEAARGVEQYVVDSPDPRGRGRVFAEAHKTESEGTLPREFRPDDLAVIFYTSGTTSRPKGVTLTRAALAASTATFLARVPIGPADVALVAAAIARPFALRTQVLPMLHAGGTVALLERFSPAHYLAALRQPPAKTFLALIPSALHQVIHHPEARPGDFAGLRLCICGGDRVPLALHRAFRTMAGLELTEQCGMTETSMYALNPPFGSKKPGSIGLPMYGVQLRLVDGQGTDVPAGKEGEIIIRSPLAMDGYWNDTAQTRKALQNGWVATGDLGRFDEDGYLWFVGRKKDIIVHDGWNVCPAEVEEVLLRHPAVSEACVVGVTDAIHGQNIHAFVTPRPNSPMPEEDELMRFGQSLLSRQMVPERIRVVPALLRTGAGKIDRDRLLWQAEAGTTDIG